MRKLEATLKMKLQVNGQIHDISPGWREETLLTVLREHLGLVGAKHGCGQGACGACTVHIDGVAHQSCIIAPIDVEGAEILTIEGLPSAKGQLHPVQQAWLEERVVQCGFCQAGQIMQAVALLSENPAPSKDDISDAMSANLCRCGTQARIQNAIMRATELMGATHEDAE